MVLFCSLKMYRAEADENMEASEQELRRKPETTN